MCNGNAALQRFQGRSRRYKILFLARALDIGGAQRQLVELATALHRTDWDVVVATFYGGGVFEKHLAEAGVPTVCLNKRGRWDVLVFLFRLTRLLRNERPDIVHGYLDSANILLALLSPALPSARVVWGLASSEADLRCYDWLWRVEFKLGALFSRFADLIISNSHAGVRYHSNHGYRRDRMIVIPQGIDLQHFRPDGAARQQIRAEWQVAAHEKLVGVVARLDPMKGHGNFLRAAADIVQKCAHIRFVCIGEGPAEYQAQLLELTGELDLQDRVLWPGSRTDMARIYNAFDVVVLPSSFGEGLPNAIAEAMATGIRCVVTDVGDSAMLVGDAGWVCKPDASSELARCILDALEAPHDPRAIRERILTSYNSGEQAKSASSALLRLMHGSASI